MPEKRWIFQLKHDFLLLASKKETLGAWYWSLRKKELRLLQRIGVSVVVSEFKEAHDMRVILA